jgi:hypothetical protein
LAQTRTEPPWEDGQGWRVLAPDGTVLDSGPVIRLEEHFGELDGTDG